MKRFIEFIKSTWALQLQDFINFIHYFDRFKDPDPKVNQYAKELRKTGIITIENFTSREECEKIRENILELAGRYTSTTKLDNGTYFDYRSEKNNSGADHGMIDIYNIDRSIEKVNNIDISYLYKILEATVGGQEIHLPRVNAYVNRGITGTRVYHIDNTQPVIYKAFIYLTDVDDESYGPYAIVKGTQRFSPYVYWNLFRNLFLPKYRLPDMLVYNKKKAMHVTGKKGTLILSNQNSIHRGLPQAPGKERIALVYSFFIVSKLSYLNRSFRDILAEAKVAPDRRNGPPVSAAVSG